MKSLTALTILFLISSIAPGAGTASAAGKASGRLTINDGRTSKTIDLKYVYATAGDFTEQVVLTFTDKPLPDDPVARWNYARFAGADGKLNTLIVALNPNKRIDFSAVCLDTRGTPVSDRDCWMNFEGDNELSFDESNDEQIFESKAFDDQTVSGTIRSSRLQDADHRNRGVSFQYQVTFDCPVEDAAPEVKPLTTGSEPEKVCLEFLRSFSGSFDSVKKYFASDRRKPFEGAEGQDRFARLKYLLRPFKNISLPSHISADGKCALLTLTDEEQVERTRQVSPSPPVPGLPQPENKLFQPLLQWPPSSSKYSVARPLPPPPPPPPPPPAAMPHRGKPMIVDPPRIPKLAHVRMVIEGGQWRVDWLMFEINEPNLLVRLDSYKTYEEKEKEWEAERKAEEELFKIAGGARLAAGGGDPGKAYLEFCRAERARDKATFLRFVTGEQLEFFSGPERSPGLGGYKWFDNSSFDYKNIQVVGGTSLPEKTVLHVTGIVDFPTQGARGLVISATGRVLMVLENGRWKVLRQRWQANYSGGRLPRKGR